MTEADIARVVSRHHRPGLLVEQDDMAQAVRLKLLTDAPYIARARNPQAYARTIAHKVCAGQVKQALDLPQTLPEPF